MPKYKVLRSIAHNTAHSYVSCMNYGDEGYVMDHLRETAARTGVSVLSIDLLGSRVEPPLLRTPLLMQSAIWYRAMLERLLAAEGWTLANLRSARLSVCLRPPECRVELVDDRGIGHIGRVHELL